MASDNFIQFKTPDVSGESTDDTHKQWSEVLAWSFGSSHPTWGDPSGGTGQGMGKVDFSDFQLTKALDAATDDLLKSMWAGQHFATVTFEARRAGATGAKYIYLQVIMNEVMVTSYQIGGGGDGTPTESWAMTFAKITVTYYPQKDDGTQDAKQPASWDRTTNTKQNTA
jgi:type VI secretion system secreted protein Hcp